MKSNDIDRIDWALLDALQTDASRSNQALAEHCGVSPATSLRRVQRLRQLGLIERQVAILNPQALAQTIGHGLTAIVEIGLDRQDAGHLEAFERRMAAEPSVQQCYRVSPGPDFVLVIGARDMPAYHALTQRLFTQDTNVRHVKAFFSVHRAKFDPRLPLPTQDAGAGV